MKRGKFIAKVESCLAAIEVAMSRGCRGERPKESNWKPNCQFDGYLSSQSFQSPASALHLLLKKLSLKAKLIKKGKKSQIRDNCSSKVKSPQRQSTLSLSCTPPTTVSTEWRALFVRLDPFHLIPCSIKVALNCWCFYLSASIDIHFDNSPSALSIKGSS